MKHWGSISARLGAIPPRRFALLVFLAAWLPRLVFVLAAGRADLSLDEIEYHLLARNLSEGHGFRWFFDLKSSFRPPGFPFLLAALYYFTGPNYFLARIAQTIPAATIGLFTWMLGRRIFAESTARWAGVVAGLYPPLIFFSVALMSENIFIPLLVLTLYLIVLKSGADTPVCSGKADKIVCSTLSVLLGLVATLAILMRPEFTYLFPLLLLWLCWTSANRVVALKSSAVVMLVVAVLVAPWCVRNYHLTGRFVYLDTRTGYNLYQGYNPRANGTFDLEQAQEPIDAFIDAALQNMDLPVPLTKNEVHGLLYRELMAYRDPGQLEYPLRAQFNPEAAPSDVVMHDWAMTQVKQFVREHPLRALALVPVKCAYFWDLEHRIFLFAYANNFIGPLPRSVLALFLFLLLTPFVLLVLGSLLELVYTPRFTAMHVLLILPVAFYTLLHSLTFGEARFHYVLIPILALLAAQGVARLTGHAPRKTSRLRHTALVVFILLFALIWTHGIYMSRDRWSAVLGPHGNTSYIEF